MTRLALLLTLLVACKDAAKEKPKATVGSGTAVTAGSGSAPAEPPKPTITTPEAKLARYQECLAAFNAGKADVLAGCYGATSVREQVDNVPELSSEGSESIVEMIAAQRASFPDLAISPRIVIVRGDTIAAIHHVSGKNSVAAGGMKATNKAIGIYEAEIVKVADDGTLARQSFYVDQPTVYHQLGLLPNDSSPAPLAKPTGEPEILISKGDEREKANSALVQQVLDAVSDKKPAVIESAAADTIRFTYHGERQKVDSKKAYMKWMRETLASTDDGLVDVKGTWAAGDVVVVLDVFSGTPKGSDIQIRTNVVQFFRITDGKIVQHEMFANRLNTAVQLGIVDPEQLMQTLAAAAK